MFLGKLLILCHHYGPGPDDAEVPSSSDIYGFNLFYHLLLSSTHRPETLLADTVFSFTFTWLWFTNILILWVCQPLSSEYTTAQYPTRSWLRKRSWLAWKVFSEISQRKMPVYSAGERTPHIEWDTGILCYLFFKTKGNNHHAIFSANHGHQSYWSLILWMQPSDYDSEGLKRQPIWLQVPTV